MNKIEIYQTDDNQTEISAKFTEETVWLNQGQLSELFKQTKQNISLHVNNCFKEGELEKKATVKDSLTVQTEGKRPPNPQTFLWLQRYDEGLLDTPKGQQGGILHIPLNTVSHYENTNL